LSSKIIIGTRGSELALWQANFTQQSLHAIGVESALKIIKTKGDKIQDLSFDKLEGKGFFTKEIEDALLAGEIDLAVHSHKDLPTESPKGLVIAAVSARENPAELILIRKESVDTKQKFSFKRNAIVGTSSARRKAQLLSFRPDITLKDLRGNVPTRIEKLRNGGYDAIMLAAAGVGRLKIDLSEFHVVEPAPNEFIPAPAQGVLAWQIRESDSAMYELMQKLNSPEAQQEIETERKILKLFHGGCQIPIGVFSKVEKGNHNVWVSHAASWDSFPKRIFLQANSSHGLAETAVKKIRDNTTASVFITRDISEENYFFRALHSFGYKVSGTSLIESTEVAFQNIPSCDWIFFSSKNGVNHFFAQHPELPATTKFGVAGQGTAMALRRHGFTESFCGTSIDMEEVGKQFASLVKDKKVLFPQAADSLQNIQKQLNGIATSISLVVYKTVSKTDIKVAASDVTVFTSPSNVFAFFSAKAVPALQKAVAIGKSTNAKLREFGITTAVIPCLPDETGLAEAVFGLND
jgi:hydroxymethylbilane synthase